MDEIINNTKKIGAYWIDHKGKKIILEDLHDRATSEILEIIKENKKIIRIQPKGSLLELVDVRGSGFDMKVIEAMKEYAAGNAPYSKKCAVVGVDGLKKVVIQGIIAFSGRQFSLFDDMESAKDWLVE